jgi:hypothetical protein
MMPKFSMYVSSLRNLMLFDHKISYAFFRSQTTVSLQPALTPEQNVS